MSIIPKIKVGKRKGRNQKMDLSFDCSTTANIGMIQPTMCREMFPGEKFDVKVSSLVRLATLSVPTFGRMSLRHYHTFVPFVDLYQPFDAFLSGQRYSNGSDPGYVSGVPRTSMRDLVTYLVNLYSDVTICPYSDITKPFTITNTNVDSDGNVYTYGPDGDYETYLLALKAAQAYDLAKLQTAWTDITGASRPMFGQASPIIKLFEAYHMNPGSLDGESNGCLMAGSFYGSVESGDTLVISYEGSESTPNMFYNPKLTPITYEGADLITRVRISDAKDYYVLFKFKPILKRFRSIMIGLGYQFTPMGEDVTVNIFKLMAFYKAWFSLFRPNRELAFNDTKCYKFIKWVSDNYSSSLVSVTTTTIFKDFINEMFKQCTYYLPMDYFSMSVVNPQQGNSDSMVSLTTGNSSGGAASFNPASSSYNINTNSNTTLNSFSVGNVQQINPTALKLAQRLLVWTNKNTVIGRSIREYMKVHFGVEDVNPVDSDGVYRIGSSRTNIQISDVMSTAETAEGALGEYAGRGIGFGDSEKFDFTADKFGVWITLSVIVPESGYYQGYMRENRHLSRLEFFNGEFDAMGYQTLERGEIMHDWNCDNYKPGSSTDWNPATALATSAFGFVPRYSEYKVGRNIVNGDLSLVGLYNSMAPYTLDRRFSAGLMAGSKINLLGKLELHPVAPSYVPTAVFDGFRKIDSSDLTGQYNRIFTYGKNDLDHFIIHNVFAVDAYADIKPLSESFETVDGDDDTTIDVTHS